MTTCSDPDQDIDESLEKIHAQRVETIRVIGSKLTKKNIVQYMHLYYPRYRQACGNHTSGSFIFIVQDDRYCYDRRYQAESFTITIGCYSDEVKDLLILTKRVWPHILEREWKSSPAAVTSYDTTSSGFRTRIFEIVSKEMATGISLIEEDYIHDTEVYLTYIQKHDIHREDWWVSLDLTERQRFTQLIKDGLWEALTHRLIQFLSPPMLEIEYRNWWTQHRLAMWVNQRVRLINIALALLPLKLPTYVQLWILDWIPPFDFRWYKKDGDISILYDLNHVNKLRLIESIGQSYENMVSERVTI